MTNNNNSDKIYVIVGVVCFLCFISSGAALFIRHIIKSDTSKKSPSQSPSPSPSSSPSSSSSKDCVGVYSKVKKNKSTPGTDKFGCGPSDDPRSKKTARRSRNKHDCQFWKYTHDQTQLGTGKPCPRDDGYVIKVQWPKKENTDIVGLQFVDDPDPNTDSKVADNPQHYKSLFDQQN